MSKSLQPFSKAEKVAEQKQAEMKRLKVHTNVILRYSKKNNEDVECGKGIIFLR